MGKITVKHYLNMDVKPRFDRGSNTYPLYVQIIANRVNYKMKSNFDFWEGYIREIDFDTPFIQNAIRKEKETIETVVAYLLDNNKNEFMNADSFKRLSSNLWSYLNDNFWKIFVKEATNIIKITCPKVFYNTTYYDINEILLFTQSEIELDFSEEYRYLRIAMDSLKEAFMEKEKNHLEIGKITIFDFLFGNGRRNVLEAIHEYHGFYGDIGEEKVEYENVMKALEYAVLFK